MPPDQDRYVDDDELLERAVRQIDAWKPSLTSVQQVFYELIRDGGSKMLRDKVVDALIVAFETKLGGKRALISTWVHIEEEVAAKRAQAARESLDEEFAAPTAEQKANLREDLWPKICDLAKAPDLLERVVQQVQSLGVVNEGGLIKLM